MRHRLRSGCLLLTAVTDSDEVTRFVVICLIIAYTLIVNEKSTSMHLFMRLCVFNMYYKKRKKNRFGFRHWFVLIGNGIGFRWQKINNVMRDLAYLSFLTRGQKNIEKSIIPWEVPWNDDDDDDVIGESICRTCILRESKEIFFIVHSLRCKYGRYIQ